MDKIQAQLILEILGRPAEHVLNALDILVKNLSSEKGIRIIEQTLHEPRLIKDTKDMYTSFAEVVIESDSLSLFLSVLFAYMPAHVEIISPEKIILTNTEISQLSTRLMQRLHDYDSITKKMIHERDIAMNKLKEVAPQMFKEDKSEVTYSINHPSQKSKKSKKKSKKAK